MFISFGGVLFVLNTNLKQLLTKCQGDVQHGSG